jgi:type II restriction enzyme
MIEAIRGDRTPNLLVMQYNGNWQVQNLLLVPWCFFSEAAVEKRPALAEMARRAGWIGCNIRLDAIAPEGKLHLVIAGEAVESAIVRRQYSHATSLRVLPPQARGWTLDVLRAVHDLGHKQFTLSELYKSAVPKLASLHPKNRNVAPKIRQQLQVLRDLGFLQFAQRGHYQLQASFAFT